MAEDTPAPLPPEALAPVVKLAAELNEWMGRPVPPQPPPRDDQPEEERSARAFLQGFAVDYGRRLVHPAVPVSPFLFDYGRLWLGSEMAQIAWAIGWLDAPPDQRPFVPRWRRLWLQTWRDLVHSDITGYHAPYAEYDPGLIWRQGLWQALDRLLTAWGGPLDVDLLEETTIPEGHI